ncbi:peptidase C14 [Cylindrobasidium torrendii FP15055 ss-10]|uniref:Peptidase C14 n=1 Tax=Cylindrobasidium torrendii FP15055 ss-10 TaxID=1314674 RepID=A0A0D7BRM9_9AGAR|nr:peptidase C14 [Cylindrobasidium torrendii FP15055 ss-10]
MSMPEDIRTHEQGPTFKRKGLVIGINYKSWASHPALKEYVLHSCVSDAQRARDFLVSTCGYEPCDVRMLGDSQVTDEDKAEDEYEDSEGVRDHETLPTRDNIIRAMEWLVEDAQHGDKFFLHYSGHGGQVKDMHGDEIDGMDEVIWPVDGTPTEGHITDDTMWNVLVSHLPSGCQLTAMFDCCHAGTMLDLPLVYDPSTGKIKHKSRLMHQRALRPALADVVSWASCKDSELALELSELALELSDLALELPELPTCPSPTSTPTPSPSPTPLGGGAMTSIFYTSLQKDPHQSYMALYADIRHALRGARQRPQLSTALEVVLDQKMRII